MSARACVRSCVGPFAQEPVAILSVDFSSPKLRGSKKKYFVFAAVFLLISVDFSWPKGVDTLNASSSVKVHV